MLFMTQQVVYLCPYESESGKVVTTFMKTKKQQFDLTCRRIMAKLATDAFVFKFRELVVNIVSVELEL